MTASNHAQCFSRSLARSSRADLRFVNGTTWLALAHALLPWADMGQAVTPSIVAPVSTPHVYGARE